MPHDLGLKPFRTTKTVDFCQPTEAFWRAWRESKDLLKDQGLFVLKENEVYVVARRRAEADPKTVPPPPAYQLSDTSGLLPYQVAPAGDLVARLLREGAAVDGSDPGTGKTYVTAAVLRELRLCPVVVCPMAVMKPWERVLESFGVQPLSIVNWEFARGRSYRLGRPTKDKGYVWLDLPRNACLVFDEAHRGKGEDTLNSAMIVAAKRQEIPLLLLSATLATTPREMKASGYALGEHNLFDFNNWCKALGGYKNVHNGWTFTDAAAAMREVNRRLYPAKGVRVRIEDLGDAFPETRITAEAYEVDGAEVLNEAHARLLEEIARLKALKARVRAMQSGLEDVADDEREEALALYRKAKAAAVTLALRYRQDAEARKVKVVAELAKDALESGQSVAIFVNFDDTRKRLLDILGGVSVHGGQPEEERRAAVDAFQSDRERVIVCNISAGGVGLSLHDLRGEFPRLSLIMPTWSAQDLKQVLGRVHRAGGKTKSLQRVVYAAGTVEEDVCRVVAGKLTALDALNDGDLAGEPLLAELEEEVSDDEV